jgi:N-glycosylase/DNA lyase
LEWQTYPERDRFDIIKKYLVFDEKVHEVLATFPEDPTLKNAVDKYGNLLILGQNFEEALLSYLVTPTNNIPSIRFRIREMNKRLGKKMIVDGKEFYTFPAIERIANTDLNVLLESKLGFHAKFMKSAAQKLLEDSLKVNELAAENNQEKYRSYLKTFPGIGNKVADCILIYGKGFYSEFPLDVWGQRVMQKYYNLPEKMKYEEMRQWIKNYFGEYAGWAGQYLFEFIRLSEGKIK